MKNFLKILLVYIIIITPIIGFYISTNTKDQKDLSITKSELHGVQYLEAIYKFSISLSIYKEDLSTLSDAELKLEHKSTMDKDIESIYNLRIKYPQFKNPLLHKYIKELEDTNYKDEKYFNFLDFLNHENYRIGDVSKLLFEEDRKNYFLSSLLTHYLPEYIISTLIIHNQIEEFIVTGSLSDEQRDLYIEQNKLVYLSSEELYEIIELLKVYDDSDKLVKTISEIRINLNSLPEYTKSTINWKKNDKELADYIISSYALLNLSSELSTESFRLLTVSLTSRKENIQDKVFRDQLILFALIFIITALSFYFYYVYNSSLQKDIEIKEINKALDKFVIFSRTDRNGNITYSSTALEELSGYTKDELRGKNHNIFKDSDTKSNVFKNLWETILSKKEWKGELRNRRKDNSVYWVKVAITPALDTDGEIIGFNSYREDITDKKELEEERIKTQKALDFKSMFLSNMSHEIRTPLNGILGFTHLALKTDLDDKQKEMITNIESTSDLLLGIINDILDISKIESGKMTLETVPFDLKHTIENIKNLLSIKAQEKNILFDIDYGNISHFKLLGDSLRISQILTNLLSNAIKFTSSGGVILRLSEDDDNNILFEIIDTGIGIKDSQLQTLFNEFTQADMSTSRKFGGTGLGLAISKRLVEMMDGKISVISDFGVGCTFSFKVALEKDLNSISSEDQDKIALEALEEKVNQLTDIKILVAEDNKMNQMLLNMLLENSKLELDIADDGKIAVEKFKHGKYDLVLMDIQMPNMNGLEATQAIREIDSDIPIIALSANVMKEDVQKSLDAGMNDHLAKPIEIEKLYKAILKYIK